MSRSAPASRSPRPCDGYVQLSTGEKVPTRSLIWCVGVRADPLVDGLDLATNRGRLVVDEFMSVPGAPDIYACGDCAAVPDLTRPGQICGMTAQHAQRQGKQVARNVAASLGTGKARPYKHHDVGFLVDLGGLAAAANPLNIPLSGPAANAVTRGYHLSAMSGNRMRVLADWALNAAHAPGSDIVRGDQRRIRPARRGQTTSLTGQCEGHDRTPHGVRAAADPVGFAVLVVLDLTIVNVALPSIQDGLYVATTTLQWVVSAYAVAFEGLLLLGGRLADAAGPGCSGLALADAAFAVAHGSLAALLGTLVLQGIASRLNQVSSNIAGTDGPVAARTAAPPRAAAATPVPPPCRRNPVTTATRGQGAREIVFACPAVLRSTGAPRTADQGSGPGAVTGATRCLGRDADACTNPGD